MTGELLFVINWWLLLFIIGLINIPITYLSFRNFLDLGYGLSKIIGSLIIVYLTFFVVILRVASFSDLTLAIVFGLSVFVNLFIFIKNHDKILVSVKSNLKVIILSEVFFTLGFGLWTVIRSYHPDINGLEKLMDFGFINSVLRSESFPPIDMWFAGRSINYYWFGHLFVAVLTKLSSIPSYITYNLMLATILGFTLTASFSIISTLIKKVDKTKTKTAISAGIISAILLAFGGNFHAPIYVFKDGIENYWYPDATRFIGHHPETDDKTIHEFPIYSFVVSDLHAHLINLPFVLLFIAFLSNYVVNTYSKPQLSSPKSKVRGPKQYNFQNSQNKGSEIFSNGNLPNKITSLIPLGFVLGIMFMTNTWDFGNYLLTLIIVLGFFYIKRGFDIKSAINTFAALLSILIISAFFALPFILNFESITQGVKFVNAHTPLWQLGVLWGFPAILTTTFAIFLYKFRSKLKKSDLFIFSLLISSWILIFIPEIVYVKDIYISSHHRANTMFKLTYQAFVMFYLSSGYIAIRILTLIKKQKIKFLALVFFVILFGSVLTYPSFAISDFYGGLKKYEGISGNQWLKNKYPNEYEIIKWFNESVEGQPVILEAPGDSYTDFNVVSSYTGLPTVSGWFVHEWLWRGDSKYPQERVSDTNFIYTSNDIEITKKLLKKYNVEYIIVGTFEHQKYPNLNEEKFTQLGIPIFFSGDARIYQVNN